MAASSPTNQTQVCIPPNNFITFQQVINGCQCFFVHKNDWLTIEVPTTRLMLTRNSYIAILNLSKIFRYRLASYVQNFFHSLNLALAMANPFSATAHEAIFFEFSPDTSVNQLVGGNGFLEEKNCNAPLPRVVFNGSIVAVVKGLRAVIYFIPSLCHKN